MLRGNHGQFRAGKTFGSLLLDSISVQASAAYSLRKLRAGYSGACIRVRRSSDNSELDIGFAGAGVLDTATLLSFVGAGNGFVTTWYDQSGNSKNATQTTASLQPAICLSGVLQKTTNGSFAAINYTTLGMSLVSSRVLNAVDESAILYAGESRLNRTTPFSANGSDTINRYSCHVPDTNEIVSDILGATGSAPSRLKTSYASYGYDRLFLTGVYNSNNSNTRQIRFNSAITSGSVRSGALSQGSLQLGATLYGGDYRMTGRFCEFLVFESSAINSQLSLIESNINAHYSIY